MRIELKGRNIINSLTSELKNIFRISNRKDLGWIVIGQILFGLGSLVGIKLITSLLNPGDYGMLALILTFTTLFQQIIFSPLQQSVMRFILPAKEESKLDEFLKIGRQLYGKATLLVAGVSFLVILFFFINKNQSVSQILIVTTFFTIFSAYKSTLDSLLNTLFHRRLSVIFQSSEIWLRYILASLALYLISRDVIFAMLGFFISVMITYFIEIKEFNKITSKQPELKEYSKPTNWQKLIINYGLPFSMWGIFTWLESASPRWILQLHSSTHEVGLFAASYQLGFYPMSLLSGVLLQYMVPVAFNRAGKGDDMKRINEAFNIIKTITVSAFLIVIVAFVFSIVFRDFLVNILLGDKFNEVRRYFPYLLLGSGFYMLGQIISVYFLSQNKSKELLVIKILVALILVLLTFFLTVEYSISGTVFSILLAYLIYFILMLIINFKKIQYKF